MTTLSESLQDWLRANRAQRYGVSHVDPGYSRLVVTGYDGAAWLMDGRDAQIEEAAELAWIAIRDVGRT